MRNRLEKKNPPGENRVKRIKVKQARVEQSSNSTPVVQSGRTGNMCVSRVTSHEGKVEGNLDYDR